MGKGSYIQAYFAAQNSQIISKPLNVPYDRHKSLINCFFTDKKDETPTRFSHRREFGPGFRIRMKSWNYIFWNRLIIRDRKITYRFDFWPKNIMNETKIKQLHKRLCETSRECVAKDNRFFPQGILDTTRNWLQARLSVYPPQNYLRLITSFKSNMQNICQKYLFSIIILHENPPYV